MSATCSVPLRIAPDHPALAGHFPGNPVVPGVVLLERVAAAYRVWRGQRVRRLDAKFARPLRPGDAAVIELDDVGGQIRFEVRLAGGAGIARGTLARDVQG